MDTPLLKSFNPKSKIQNPKWQQSSSRGDDPIAASCTAITGHVTPAANPGRLDGTIRSRAESGKPKADGLRAFGSRLSAFGFSQIQPAPLAAAGGGGP
jgi:hypothetical protein